MFIWPRFLAVQVSEMMSLFLIVLSSNAVAYCWSHSCTDAIRWYCMFASDCMVGSLCLLQTTVRMASPSTGLDSLLEIATICSRLRSLPTIHCCMLVQAIWKLAATSMCEANSSDAFPGVVAWRPPWAPSTVAERSFELWASISLLCWASIYIEQGFLQIILFQKLVNSLAQ
ncbi:hypothetical protein FGO68_gene11441 [Halteria grandinella]|uniref:Secreted protein n=1 Tax=Halteria grandinella TaxID=5974 RepID=A0A8J8NN21_HALGN|nr:hypothetical protein FGO68_gene11441 [Halteria grandinella]